MSDLIGIGLSGLKSYQVALSVTGNNVANTNTQGYSRQEAVFADNDSLRTGEGFIGQGVNIETVRRISQEFLVEQVRSDTVVYNERKALLEQAENVDNLLASTTTGLTPALSRFFQAFQGSADDPTSIPQRQLLLTQSEGLVSRFRSLDNRLNSQLENIDQELDAAVSSINSLAQSLVELNQSISTAVGAGQGDEPNSLLDERDEVLRQLSEMVSVSVFPQGNDGRVDVFIGNGQSLVSGNSAAVLQAVPSASDTRQKDIALVANGASQVISGDLTGGKIGGLLRFREENLADAINSLGRIALVMADTINEQHQLGMDLESNLGGLYFNDVNDQTLARSRVFANSNNVPPNDQVLRVNIIDTSALTTDDYELRFEGPSNDDYLILRKGSNEVIQKSALPGIFPANLEIDGFQLQFESGSYKVGDRFTIQPTKAGALDISLTVDRVEEVALASPIRGDANIGNVGNAELSLGTMLDVNNPRTNQAIPIFGSGGQLAPPLGINFITDTIYEVVNLTDPSNPAPLTPPMNNRLYNQGVTNSLFTEDPGETRVMAAGSDTATIPAPAPSAGPLLNGYGAQNLTFLARDTTTGVVTSQTLGIVANSSAKDIATSIASVQGVQANAYTYARLSNFVDDGDPTPLGVEINGEALTVAASTTFGPDALADLINTNTNLQTLNIYAVSDGVQLDIRSSTGEDIQVVVTGVGDSVDVSKIDPYSTGSPVLSTQTVNAGQGVAVAGAIDVTLADGLSFTSSVETVFELAPVAQSTYLGFQFELKGEPQAGDRFTIGYNAGGVSDNRNALALAAMEGSGQIGNGIISYGEAYSQIIEEIGTVTNRARLDAESAEALLTQSTSNRESVSGVNLDEEAGRLIQFQASYNASAQVVAVARELFDTLLATFR